MFPDQYNIFEGEVNFTLHIKDIFGVLQDFVTYQSTKCIHERLPK